MREQRALRRHVGLADGAELETLLQDVELLRIGGHEASRDLYLLGIGGVGDRRGDHIRGQREIGGLELEALVLGRRRVALDGSDRLAEHIGREGNGDIRVEKRVAKRRRGVIS